MNRPPNDPSLVAACRDSDDLPDLHERCLSILREELVGAMGCTEPISLAFAGARARQVLGAMPDRVVVHCSGNMIKNVRCVTIPNSGNMMGIEAAVALGIAGGNAEAGMEVLRGIDEAHRQQMHRMLDEHRCQVRFLESDKPLHIALELWRGDESVELEIQDAHTNVVRIAKNGVTLLDRRDEGEALRHQTDRSCLNIERIKRFADEVAIEEVKPTLDRQIQCNMDIAYEGMAGDYGVGIGRIIRDSHPESVLMRMKAYTAAASEARMGGCEMPVIINSGSGNQGIASSVPVIVYAREKSLPQERLYRALAFSNLLTIYQKEYIGRLSAFCGAVSASCSSGTALTYICGGTLKNIKDTIDNTLANIPGIICDGAKVSCAAKIATSLDAAVMAHEMAMRGQAYGAFTGILQGEIGATISSVGYIGRVGMMQTDREIIHLMIGH